MQGQTQGKARRHGGAPAAEYEEGHGSYGRGSPPVPGSPLTYSPQVGRFGGSEALGMPA